MAGILYQLADFVTGGPILDLPVMEGASWASQLNRPDALSCEVTLKDAETRALDLRSATEPDKTILRACTEDDETVAWGLIKSRDYDEDKRTLALDASGIRSGYFGETAIMPPAALTVPPVIIGPEGFRVINPVLDTVLSGLSLGTIGKRLVEQRLAFPGSPMPFDLPPDELGDAEREYLFSAMKAIESALTDLSGVINGPDFAFDAYRDSDGLSLRYALRHGSTANPRIGVKAGTWSLGGDSPITEFKVNDVSRIASATWLTAGKQSSDVLVSRTVDASVIADGYPPFDAIDTTHSDVALQATLDEYGAEIQRDARKPGRDLSFTVRGDASPRLGQYRPGDTIDIDVPEDHPYLMGAIPIRLTSMSGDETGLDVKIGCVIDDGT